MHNAATPAPGNLAHYNSELPYLEAPPEITGISLDPITGDITLSWTKPSSRGVAVEASTNLIRWSTVATFPKNQTSGTIGAPPDPVPYRFFRLRYP